MASQDAILSDRQAVSWAATAALTWMAWDTIIHWDAEMECIWQRPKSWVKVAYIIVRYLPIFNMGATATMNMPIHFSSAGCLGWVVDQLVFMEIVTIVVEVILVMRLYILYNRNKVILWTIVILFAVEIAVMISALAVSLPKITFEGHCYVLSAPSFYAAYWMASLIFETFLFILTLAVFFRSIRKEYRANTIIHVFVRDGTWAFAMIFVALLLNMLMYKLIDNPLAGMGYPWGLSTLSFAGSHILLNLRRLAVPQYPTGLSADNTMATMRFEDGCLETEDVDVLDTFAYPDTTPSTTAASTPKGTAAIAKSYKRTFKSVLNKFKIASTPQYSDVSEANSSSTLYNCGEHNSSQDTLVDNTSPPKSKLKSILKKLKRRPNKRVSSDKDTLSGEADDDADERTLCEFRSGSTVKGKAKKVTFAEEDDVFLISSPVAPHPISTEVVIAAESTGDLSCPSPCPEPTSSTEDYSQLWLELFGPSPPPSPREVSKLPHLTLSTPCRPTVTVQPRVSTASRFFSLYVDQDETDDDLDDDDLECPLSPTPGVARLQGSQEKVGAGSEEDELIDPIFSPLDLGHVNGMENALARRTAIGITYVGTSGRPTSSFR
ncbi:hypothetical protein NM688_g3686 [Phlebia brevispora]|uniref:Uncharacterized protein n=1 Tax=Phlebia brevispora TaxID=194682 RepID=A0ACC1T5F1_9APHY|nr:hypothetical protein NM688_g3686 [Phlebia brevispora]